jgi:NitT/TauT family transport system substrate-binding protein
MHVKYISSLLLIIALLATGCQKDSSSSEKRLLLDWLPNPNHVPLYVGIENGYFRNRGINLSILKLQDPSDSLPYLTSEQADLALYYMPDTIRALKRGLNLKVVGVLYKQPLNCFIYRTDSKIKTPADLNGKTIGYCVDGNSTLILDHLLALNHIVPHEKRNVSFDLISTLGTGQVDVIYGAYYNVESDHLSSLGIDTEYFDLRMFGHPNYYELLVLANGNSKNITPEFISAFQEGLQESIEFSRKNPQRAFEIYVKANPDKSLQTLEWEKKGWQKTYPILADNQKMDQQIWDSYSEWLNQFITRIPGH